MLNRPSQPPIAALLFGSGLCALVYQTVWLREFRLIFGASTAASAAVLGIFMAGLGLGSALLGRRAEATKRPLEFYANLEVLISVSAALTPFLLYLARSLYITTGGSPVLGQTGATFVRLILSAVVLAIPTILMGGTLPAAARAAEHEDDQGRRRLAFLYGANTLGAVAGASLSTFVLIEHLGNRQALWFACGINLLVAIVGRVMGRRMADVISTPAEVAEAATASKVSRKFVVVAAAGVGFAFMLMELVWYRMLGSILGGSTFTFGLILAVALLGIGIGGGLYALLRSNTQPTAQAFAGTCALEAVCIAVPFALGDRIAFLALQLRELSAFGFAGHLLGWSIVTAVVILPAAIVAGYQFPMLIALLGRGREGVGRDTALAYVANTLGAIVGSIAGGFILLPVLSALGSWKLVVVLLAVLAVLAFMQGLARKERLQFGSLAGAAAAVLMLFATGPTAAWRHSGIGAGRAPINWTVPNVGEMVIRTFRRHTTWEVDGVESSVALSTQNAYSFIVNGKSDGNIRGDMGTQIMSGMIGAIIHPNPKKTMVIGLGTGSTAGWLGAIPSMERVDVAELEPAILHVADVCSPMNENVLRNPKVKVHLGDARETLLTARENYDLIFSEPSNPYRAGIASLFSLDFYEAAANRLAPGGYFLQWVQTYDIDSEALHTVYATLGSVFPHVDTWYTTSGDLMLLASKEPVAIDLERVRSRVNAEPYSRALRHAWMVDSAEGFLAHYIAGSGFVKLCKASDAPISTDDRNYLEFGFARGVGKGRVGDWMDELRQLARERGWNRPNVVGTVDWQKVDAQRYSQRAKFTQPTPAEQGESPEFIARRDVVNAYLGDNFKAVVDAWKKQPFEALNPLETQILAESFVVAELPEAEKFIAKVREHRPIDADAIEARKKWKAKDYAGAVELLERVFQSWQSDPWIDERLAINTLKVANQLITDSRDAALAERLYQVLRKPFVVFLRDAHRHSVALVAADQSGTNARKNLLEILDQIGPHAVWTKEALATRLRVFRGADHPLREQAEADYEAFTDLEPRRFRDGLLLPPTKGTDMVASARPIEIPGTTSNAPLAAPAPAPAGQDGTPVEANTTR